MSKHVKDEPVGLWSRIVGKFTRKQWMQILGMLLVFLYMVLSFWANFSCEDGFSCGSKPVDLEKLKK